MKTTQTARRLTRGRATIPSHLAGQTIGRRVDTSSPEGKHPEFSPAHLKTRSLKPAEVEAINNDQFLDESAVNTTTSSIGQLWHQNSVLDEFLPPDLFNDSNAQAASTNKTHQIVNEIYRDMYYHDPVCGNAVDTISKMPFSEFVLGGVRDQRVLEPFYTSLDNLSINSLLPTLSVDYLVSGLFVATLMFDENAGVFTGIVPQNVDNVDIQPLPMFGHDPLVVLRVGDALKSMKNISDPRIEAYRTMISGAGGKDPTHTPNPEDVIYLPRRAMTRDSRGVSIYRRILTAWLIEKSLYRGTIDQASKRQRAISHVTVGEEGWTPTADDMTIIADSLMAAQHDPVGAVFVTRQGVNVSELGAADGFWKITDTSDFFTMIKYKALGISEAFIDGTASYNSMEQVMSTFLEQMRTYRQEVTSDLFYSRLFPRLSAKHNLTHGSHGLKSNNHIDMSGVDPFSSMELAAAGTNPMAPLIPQVKYRKKLRPEADREYFDMLDLLSQKGVPIPLRIMATAAGQDLATFVASMDEDLEDHKAMKTWKDAVKEINPPPEGEGEGGFDLGSLQLDTAPIQKLLGTITPRGLGARDHSDQEVGDVLNITTAGNRYMMTAQGKAVLTERLNKTIVEAARELARRENYFSLAQDAELVEESGKKHYGPSKRK